MLLEIDFFEAGTQRCRTVRLSVIDNGEACVLAALHKNGEKVLKVRKVIVVDPTGKCISPIQPPIKQPIEAPIESSDDSKGTISLFQPLEFS